MGASFRPALGAAGTPAALKSALRLWLLTEMPGRQSLLIRPDVGVAETVGQGLKRSPKSASRRPFMGAETKIFTLA